DAIATPAAFVPGDARWLIVDPDACRRAIRDAWADAEARYPQHGPKELAYPPDRHLVDADTALAGPRRILLPTLEVHDHADATRLRVELDDLRVLRQELDHARTFGDTEHVQPLLA